MRASLNGNEVAAPHLLYKTRPTNEPENDKIVKALAQLPALLEVVPGDESLGAGGTMTHVARQQLRIKLNKLIVRAKRLYPNQD